MIEVCTLGTAELRGPDGRALHSVLAQPKRFALLVYLAVCHSYSSRRRDAVVALLWPELDPAHARGALRQALRFIRRELGDGVLNGHREEELGLADGVLWCDAIAFEEACQAGRLVDALQLYRGDFLNGFFVSGAALVFDDWVETERAHLKRLAVEAARSLTQQSEEQGDVPLAVLWARRTLSLRPDDEETVRRLISLLDRLGDRVAAVHMYEEFARRIAQDYNIVPAAETQALVDVVRRATTGTGEPLARPATRVDSGLTGRATARLTVRRPIRTVATIAATAVLALGGYVFASRAQPQPVLDPRRVVVEPFDNETGDSSFARLGRMAADWITQGLMQTGLVQVVPATTVFLATAGRSDHAPVSRATLRRTLARETGAGVVVSGAYYRTGDSLRFQAQLLDAATGRLLQAVAPVTTAVSDPVQGVELERQRVVGSLAPLIDSKLGSWAGVQSHPPSFEGYKEFLTGWEIMNRDQDAHAALPHLYRAAATDSSYAVPLLWAVTAHLRLGERAQAESLVGILEQSRAKLAPLDRFVLDRHEAELRRDLSAALRASRQIVALAPRSEFVYWLALDAGQLNRPREAVEALEQLDQTLPWVESWQEYWARRAYSLHVLGEYRRELAVTRSARRARPELLRYLWLEVQALAAVGRIDEVRKRLDESLSLPFGQEQDQGSAWVPGEVMRNAALELRAHGYREAAQEALDRANAWYAGRPAREKRGTDARYRLLQRLYEGGRWDQATVVATSLLRTDSGKLEVRGYLGQLAARRGDLGEASRISAWFANLPSNERRADGPYFRAHIAAMLGHSEEAVRLLRESYANGFPYSYYDHLQEDLEVMSDYPPYRALMRPKG